MSTWVEVLTTSIFIMNALQLASFVKSYLMNDKSHKSTELLISEIHDNVVKMKSEIHDHVLTTIPSLAIRGGDISSRSLDVNHYPHQARTSRMSVDF